LGFMASYLVRKCLQKGWMVYGVDKCTYAANMSLLKEFKEYKNFKFEKTDIKDLSHLYDCDYIINFAAESHVGNSIIDSKSFLQSNIIGIKNILDLLRLRQDNCVDKPILFHISTDEVYGDITEGEFTETSMLKPSNPYAASKAAADMLILAWARTYNLNYIILRPTNNYGVGQYPEKLIPLSVKNLNRGKKIRLHDKGEPSRNWLHADDTAEAVMTIINSQEINQIFNVAGVFEQKNIETVKKIIKAYYGTFDNWNQYVDLSYEREGQDVRYALNDDKLRSLGWEPKISFDKEIKNIVDHYKNNFQW